MCPIREFICTSSECNEKDTIKELLVGMNEVPNCENCMTPLVQTYTTGPAGLVRGSRNPCYKKN